jgi:hypothetical protein
LASQADNAGEDAAPRMSSFTGGTDDQTHSSDADSQSWMNDTIDTDIGDVRLAMEGADIAGGGDVEGGVGDDGAGQRRGAREEERSRAAAAGAHRPARAGSFSGGRRPSPDSRGAVGVKARQHPDVTVVFIDIVGFSEMCNEVTPFRVLRFLEHYFDLVGLYSLYSC